MRDTSPQPLEVTPVKHEGKVSLQERRYMSPCKWKDIQYLRELAMLEIIYFDLDNTRFPTDPDQLLCMTHVVEVGRVYQEHTPTHWQH